MIAVNKPRGNYPIVLAGINNLVRIHHEAIEQPWFLHGEQTDGYRNDDDPKRESELHGAKYDTVL